MSQNNLLSLMSQVGMELSVCNYDHISVTLLNEGLAWAIENKFCVPPFYIHYLSAKIDDFNNTTLYERRYGLKSVGDEQFVYYFSRELRSTVFMLLYLQTLANIVEDQVTTLDRPLTEDETNAIVKLVDECFEKDILYDELDIAGGKKRKAQNHVKGKVNVVDVSSDKPNKQDLKSDIIQESEIKQEEAKDKTEKTGSPLPETDNKSKDKQESHSLVEPKGKEDPIQKDQPLELEKKENPENVDEAKKASEKPESKPIINEGINNTIPKLEGLVNFAEYSKEIYKNQKKEKPKSVNKNPPQEMSKKMIKGVEVIDESSNGQLKSNKEVKERPAKDKNKSSVFEHLHRCDKCGVEYKHSHSGKPSTDINAHKQRGFQCPSEVCEWYYGKGNVEAQANPTKSVLIQSKPQKDKKLIYGEMKINQFLVNKNATSLALEIYSEFYKEFQINKQDVLVPNPDCFLKVLDTTNLHYIYAELRRLAHIAVMYEIQYKNHYGGDFKFTTGENLTGPISVYSIACKFSRIIHFLQKGSKLISCNPVLQHADAERNSENSKIMKITNGITYYHTTEKISKGKGCKALNSYLASNTLMGSTKPKYITRNLVQTRGDGWCVYRSLCRYIHGNDDFLTFRTLFLESEDVCLEHKVNDTKYSISFREFFNDNFNEVYGMTALAVYNCTHGDLQNSSLYKVWGSLSQGTPLKLVQNHSIPIYIATKHGKELLLGSWDKPTNNKCVIHSGDHVDFYEGDFGTVNVPGSERLYGIHNDVHYYPEVFEHICEMSEYFPQYIIGWTFTDKNGTYSDKTKTMTVKIQDGSVRMSVQGNSSCNSYSHPNFVMTEDVAYRTFNNKTYRLVTIRQYNVENFGWYRIFKVEKSIIDPDFTDVSVKKESSIVDFFKTTFGQDKVKLSNGGMVEVTETTTYLYSHSTLTEASFVDRKAPSEEVMKFFQELLKEKKVARSCNLISRNLPDSKDKKSTLDAYFIANELSSQWIISVGYDLSLNPIHREANRVMQGGDIEVTQNPLEVLKLAVEKQNHRDRNELMSRSGESFLKYCYRYSKCIIAKNFWMVISGFSWVFGITYIRGLWKAERSTIIAGPKTMIGRHLKYYNQRFSWRLPHKSYMTCLTEEVSTQLGVPTPSEIVTNLVETVIPPKRTITGTITNFFTRKVEALKPTNYIGSCITSYNSYLAKDTLNKELTTVGKIRSTFIIATGLICLSWVLYKIYPSMRAMWNKEKPIVFQTDSKKPLSFSSHCDLSLGKSGFINEKTKEMIQVGFNQNLEKDGKKKIQIKSCPLPSYVMENNNENTLACIRDKLKCQREPDTAILSKGPNFGLYPIKYHTCPYNMWIALLRIFNPVPTPDPKIVEEYGKWYTTVEMPQLLKKVDVLKEYPTFNDWLTNVKPYVRKFVLEILDKDHAYNTSRVGFEIGVKTDELMAGVEDDVRPRPIQQARNIDKYTYSGIWYITKIIADVDYAYRCGANWEEDARVLAEITHYVDDYIMIPGDLSSNDATQSYSEREVSDLILIRHILSKLDVEWVKNYEAAFANVTGISQQKATIFTYGDFRAELKGSQNTGASDTTFGNTERNRRRMKFLLTEKLGLKEVSYTHINGCRVFGKGDYGILVLGDDFLLVINKKFKTLVEENMHLIYCKERFATGGLGHWFKDALSCDWPEFCSRDLIDRGDGSFRWIRKIKKFVQCTPFTISVKPTTNMTVIEGELKKLAYMEGVGILKWARGLPLYHKYAQTLIRLGQEVPLEEIEEKYMKRWEARAIGEVNDVRPEDYNLVLEYWEKRYNISRTTVKYLEDALDCCTSLYDQIYSEELLSAFKFKPQYKHYLIDTDVESQYSRRRLTPLCA